MTHSFLQSAPITLKTDSNKVPYSFTFAAASSETANDGSIPFETTITSAAVTILDASGNDVSSEILVAKSATTTVISMTLKYPATSGAGTYSIKMILTLSTTATMEFIFDQLIAEGSTFIDFDDLKLEMGINKPDDEDLLKNMVNAVEPLWDLLTNKTWYLTTHKETLCGSGNTSLFLKNYPIRTVVSLVTSWEGAMSIKNTNSSTYATVSVSSTAITLNYNGTESTVLLATYTTITAVVNQINTIGSGWVASVLGSFGDYLSAELQEMFGSNCINSTLLDLNVPSEYSYDFNVNPLTGELHNPRGFIPGFQNIQVKYTAGYTAVTLPKNIKQIMIRQASHWYRQARGKNWDYTSIDKIEGGTVNFSKTKEMNLLPDFVKIARMNRKINV